MHDAAVYCNAHQSETVDMIAQFANLDPNVVRRMARVTFAEYLTPAEIQPLVNVAAKYKVIDHAFSAARISLDQPLDALKAGPGLTSRRPRRRPLAEDP